MNNLVVINIGDGPGFSRRVGGREVLGRVLDYAERLVPRKDIAIIGSAGVSGAEGLKTVVMPGRTDRDLVKTLTEISAGYDTIVLVHGDCPFLDSELTLRMLQNHLRYFAEYTFADGYPFGLAPEIIKTAALPAIGALLKDPPSPITRETIFTLIQRDINSFDLETELSPVDLRLLRVSLTADTRRNALLCERLAAENPGGSEDIIRLLQEKPEALRTLPAYAGVQIVEGCPQACFSCPYPLFGGDILKRRASMPPADFDRIAGKIADFSEDAVIGVSLWGEPALHPRFLELAESIAKRPALSLLVETSGIGWSDSVAAEAGRILGGRISWIVSLDAADKAMYSRLRGAGYEEAVGRAEKLLAMYPDRVYVQALRMKENEEQMETFFRSWKEKTPNLIIQKYDWFSGFLPQRKVTDLSPLERFPCRHLGRDLTILMDGSVPLCREDLEIRGGLGNILTDELTVIWERGAAVYREHLAKNYPALCGTCDEYYTYNF